MVVEIAVSRLLAAVKRHPDRPRFLGFWLEEIRREPKAKGRSNTGDLGSEIVPWYTRLTDDEVRTYREERRSLAPELDEAPVGITGPGYELADLNAKWRAVAEARVGGDSP